MTPVYNKVIQYHLCLIIVDRKTLPEVVVPSVVVGAVVARKNQIDNEWNELLVYNLNGMYNVFTTHYGIALLSKQICQRPDILAF